MPERERRCYPVCSEIFCNDLIHITKAEQVQKFTVLFSFYFVSNVILKCRVFLREFGLKVSNLYISQVKRKCGIEVGENYNLPKSENARVPQCPKEKEDAIRSALKYFAMI